MSRQARKGEEGRMGTESTTSSVTLTVPSEYSLPPFFCTSSAEEVASALDAAASLTGFLRSRSEEGSVRSCVRSALEEYRSAEVRLLGGKVEEERRLRSDAERELRFLREGERQRTDAAVAAAVAVATAEERKRGVEEARAALSEAVREKSTAEREMCDALREKCASTERHAAEMARLQSRVAELETPMGRGTVGEVDVAQCLRDMGMVVEDTSTGEAKNAGFLDLLAYEDGPSPLKIAIEVKNRREVKRENLVAFEAHVAAGIESKLFDSAIFVSLRSHVKRGSPLRMAEDADGLPLVPVSYVGPEKGRGAAPLSSDHLEAHVSLHAALLERTKEVRRFLDGRAAAETEEDREEVKAMVEGMVEEVNLTVSDLAHASALVEEMRVAVTSAKSRCVRLFAAACAANRKVPWLRRAIDPPWFAAYETAVRKKETHTDAQIWNEYNKDKSVVERTVGKEALFRAARGGATAPSAHSAKRPKA